MSLKGKTKKIILFLAITVALLGLSAAVGKDTLGSRLIYSFIKIKISNPIAYELDNNNPTFLPAPLYNNENAAQESNKPAPSDNQNQEDTEESPPKISNAGELSISGVLSWTNAARQKNDLDALIINSQLNDAAAGKLQDMFDKQYFEHISPSGENPSYWVEKFGYSYIIMGENLALGNFGSDQNLVNAWMESPGHKANILNYRYTEIGIAVEKGIYNGRSVWIAVQEFGMPASFCPQPNPNLKAEILNGQKRIDELKNIIANSGGYVVPDAKSQDSKENSGKDAVSEYNELIKSIGKLLGQYNDQVETYNKCISNK
ncbi:MAG: CAP domain-containing protein [Patescibacteria group bacterium]